MANLSNWQDSLDKGLVNRLHRPLRQPGMMKMAMGQRIINRCDRFLNRLPLLNQQMQRWGNTNTLSSESMPIVYAQPVSLAKEQAVENRVHNLPTVSQVEPSANIIQRKLDSSQFLPIIIANNTNPVQNITDLSSSDFANETTQSLALKTQINKTSISSPEIPVVSSQPIGEQFPKAAEMTLGDLTGSQTSLPNITESNLNHPSQPIVDKTSIFSSEIPVVLSQPIGEQFPKTAEMTLGDLTGSQTYLLNSTESNLNHPSQPIVDKTSIFSSKIPVVLSQPIAEQLPKTAETLLSQKFTSLPDTTLPIIQAKLQNYAISQPSLPIVNDLNNLAGQQQTQADNETSNLSSIKHESKKLPIVTAQPLTPQVDLTKKEISFAINSPTYQSQPATSLNTQPFTISTSQINQNNHKQNISSLPVVSVTSVSNPSLKPQSLPLPGAKTTPSSRSNSQQSNLSNHNSISNMDSSSPPRTFTSSVSSIETSVSPIATQSNIDVDAIANQVERKLMRRLVIESERRGKNRWH
ncbi:hypothetical protein [Nostoc sp. UHCC 0251]|uniref:hypothetical protein n=1 Tax=Nostoc sp. UHCC 0251 TaxID=3110240 RepID=UPI002B1EED8F|nr:hypothetical protein [Nostoc sp. UHCC 0251]MEA5622910.1 hypothetical protein [Nostoc sp. UHCC 0251]